MDRRIRAETAALMGMNSNRLEEALKLIDKEVERREIPGATAAVSRNGHTVQYAVGHSIDTAGEKIPTRTDTIYDCASLTKVVVTLPLILRLLENGVIRLADQVAVYLEEFGSNGKQDITIKQLLTHTAGLMPFDDLHSKGWGPEHILREVMSQQLEYSPGTRVIYSDMGFIVLGALIERLSGLSLQEAARREVFEPLGMTDSGYVPDKRLRERIAATEHYPYEEEARRGVVHDENASALGGISGHAGLFATAEDLTRYASAWMKACLGHDNTLLSPAAARLAVRNHTMELETGNRGLGWALRGDKFDASGDLLGETSFGHTGFTGTSLYIDPELGVTIVLLTNRVHYGRSKSVAALRAGFHNAIAAAVAD